MEWELNAFMAMVITTALKIKNNKKQYSVNKTQQYKNKIYVHVKPEINKHLRCQQKLCLRAFFECMKTKILT